MSSFQSCRNKLTTIHPDGRGTDHITTKLARSIFTHLPKHTGRIEADQAISSEADMYTIRGSQVHIKQLHQSTKHSRSKRRNVVIHDPLRVSSSMTHRDTLTTLQQGEKYPDRNLPKLTSRIRTVHKNFGKPDIHTHSWASGAYTEMTSQCEALKK